MFIPIDGEELISTDLVHYVLVHCEVGFIYNLLPDAVIHPIYIRLHVLLTIIYSL